jgi:hypothetical protein
VTISDLTKAPFPWYGGKRKAAPLIWERFGDVGHYVEPFYKPDWSPERLRAQNYCCHLSVLRRSLTVEVGGFRPGFEGSQDYDIILRVTEKARRVHHLPEVLYHWRKVPMSVASDPGAKPYAYESGRRAVQEHCDRMGIDAVVESEELLGTYRAVADDRQAMSRLVGV